jgi:uncharacterized RDD family membrane protein YckC
MANFKQPAGAGFFRRLGAWFYDSLIIIAIEIIAAGIIVAILEALVSVGIIHYQHYSDSSDFLSNHPLWAPIFTAYIVTIWIGFFVFFWCKGQTLGMRAWRLIIVNEDGGNISPTQALIRLFTSAFGLSNLAVLIDPNKRGFHDIWAKTHVMVIDKG